MNRQTNGAIETLMDLFIGITLYFIIFEIVGLIFVENRLSYTIGLVLGCAAAAFMAWHMFTSIDSALDMPEQDAVKYSRKRSLIRWLVMLAAAFAGMRLEIISFPAVITGILGLKIAAFCQPYTNLYITKKLRKEGR
ncbi:MAG: hypothetical protein Q4B70_04500 [Lachnospiraceae bacterium]|nr:hypothetical protein [Lachnospiraceae bacterium]